MKKLEGSRIIKSVENQGDFKIVKISWRWSGKIFCQSTDFQIEADAADYKTIMILLHNNDDNKELFFFPFC